MVTIPLGVGDWASATENIARLRLRNMYLIDNPESPDGISRVSRPTLTEFSTVGTGPIYGVWRQDATFDNDWLIVSGKELYRFNPTTKVSTLIDSLPGTGFCQFAGTDSRVIVVRDGTAYSTDGETLSIVVMPDDVPGWEGYAAPVQSVALLNSYFLLSVTNTQRFYWIQPGEVDPDPLDFASAERIPDPIISINVLMDEIWFIGSSGPEVWQPTTDPDIPFQRINGRVYNEGCASRDIVAQSVSDNLPALFWVTATRSVVMAQGSVTEISTESVEELLKTATNLRGYTFRHNRHDFYVITADEFTYVYDITRKEWGRWDSYGRDNFRAHVSLQNQAIVYAGDLATNKIWMFEEGEDDDTDVIIREVSGTIPVPGKPVSCASVAVRVNAGWSPTLGFIPELELRWSDDQGFTWSDYVSIPLGNKGQYNTDTIFRSLGRINRPGRNFQFRFAQRARFRIDYAVMNEV